MIYIALIEIPFNDRFLVFFVVLIGLSSLRSNGARLGEEASATVEFLGDKSDEFKSLNDIIYEEN